MTSEENEFADPDETAAQRFAAGMNEYARVHARVNPGSRSDGGTPTAATPPGSGSIPSHMPDPTQVMSPSEAQGRQSIPQSRDPRGQDQTRTYRHPTVQEGNPAASRSRSDRDDVPVIQSRRSGNDTTPRRRRRFPAGFLNPQDQSQGTAVHHPMMTPPNEGDERSPQAQLEETRRQLEQARAQIQELQRLQQLEGAQHAQQTAQALDAQRLAHSQEAAQALTAQRMTLQQEARQVQMEAQQMVVGAFAHADQRVQSLEQAATAVVGTTVHSLSQQAGLHQQTSSSSR